MILLYYEHYEYEWDCWDSTFVPMQNLNDAIKQAEALAKHPKNKSEIGCIRNIKILDAQEVLNWRQK